MKIGVVVDGDAEYGSLGQLFPKLSAASGHVYLKVVRADIQPKAPYPTMARAAKDAVVQLAARGAELVIVLVDREDRTECPGQISDEVQRHLSRHVGCGLVVVLKNIAYENWLVADLGAFAAHQARYVVTDGHRRRVQPNKADQVNAVALLKSIIQGDYDKVDDSKDILEGADPDVMSQHFRSFRKFLREAQHPRYCMQSRLP
jgi:Domain of unknown function (DUF4276)